MRIAIVGAGVSGLVCAHLLRDGHDVTVFEANDYAGGHTHTVRVDTADEMTTLFDAHLLRERGDLAELLVGDRLEQRERLQSVGIHGVSW